MKVLGAIIAGGTSSRMGGSEKAFVELAGVPLIERIHSRIRFQVQTAVINASGDPARFQRFGLLVIADAMTHVKSPIAGMHAALRHGKDSGFDAVLTVPSDSPFVPLDLVDRLEEEGRGTGAAVAVSGGRIHYLTGLWSTALAPVIESAIMNEGLVRVQDFYRKVEAADVEWPTFPHDPFLNINTPEDLARAATFIHD